MKRELTVAYLEHGFVLGLEHFQRMQKINDPRNKNHKSRIIY
jgi:hypothetical protein